MANTTQANVLLIAPEFSSGISSELWTLILDDVATEINSKNYLDAGVEAIQRYLVAHYLTKNNEESSNNISEKVGKASFTRSNVDDDLRSTKYGMKVILLKKRYKLLVGC